MEKYSRDLLCKLYTMMLRIRLCEESFVEPIVNSDVRCPVHLYSGEEAVAAGVCASLDKKDYIFGTHRSHGHYLAKGGCMKELVAEIYGKKTGSSGGRGGSMHLIDPDRGMMGAAPIVAGTIALALGASLASSIRKDNRVTVSFFGDGATGEGVLYESLNFAALKKLPIIFVCENNLYSTHMSIDEIRPNRDIYKVGEPFGIKSYRCDGNDVLAVYDISKEAVTSCRKGEGPVFLEFLTYRMRGHVGPNDNIQGSRTDIRPKEEVQEWRERDPIVVFEKYLVKNGVFKEDELSRFTKEIENEIMDAYTFTQESPYSDESELENNVFKN